jgi:carotenoid 1,2-hydratase
MPTTGFFSPGSSWSEAFDAGTHDHQDARSFWTTLSGLQGGALRPGPSRVAVCLSQGLQPGAAGRPLSSGWDSTPGCGSAHGGSVGPIGGRLPDGRPCFNQSVPSGGYLWWYVDGISDCGRHGITVIVFVGSVFSPYYRSALRRAARTGKVISPEDYCAINVALYSPGQKRWAMTERSSRSLERGVDFYRLGPSQVSWQQDQLTIDVREWANPLPRPITGRIVLRPSQLFHQVETLDSLGRHRWGPIAPTAHLEVDFPKPGLRWSGHGYLDSNEGDEPIDRPFKDWDWSRADHPDGSCSVIYDVRQRDGQERVLANRYCPDGRIETLSHLRDAPWGPRAGGFNVN